MTNPQMRNMQDHYPHRDDQVAAWLKDRRDQWPDPRDYSDDVTEKIRDGIRVWHKLDDLLDEYRLAADTGQSLEQIVNAELYEAEAASERHPIRRKKKPKPDKSGGDGYLGRF